MPRQFPAALLVALALAVPARAQEAAKDLPKPAALVSDRVKDVPALQPADAAAGPPPLGVIATLRAMFRGGFAPAPRGSDDGESRRLLCRDNGETRESRETPDVTSCRTWRAPPPPKPPNLLPKPKPPPRGRQCTPAFWS